MTKYNIEAHEFRKHIERTYAHGDNVDISVDYIGELNHLDGCSFDINHMYDIQFIYLQEWETYLRNLGAVEVNIDVDGTSVHVDASWEEVMRNTNHNTELKSKWSYGTILKYLILSCLFIGVLYLSTFIQIHPIQIIQWIYYVFRNFFPRT